MTRIKVTKLEAAQRQIDVAIRMLFSGEDPAAIHTLTSAGFQILGDLLDAEQQDPIDSMIRPEKKHEFWRKQKGLANFLKYADKDPKDIYDSVEEEANDFFLYLALIRYHKLRQPLTLEMKVLQAWLTMIHPDVLQVENEDRQLRDAVEAGGTIRTLLRGEQLAIGLEVLRMARSASL